MPRHAITVALVALVALGCSQAPVSPATDSATTPTLDSMAMRQAAAQAQATLRDFLVQARQQPAGTKSYAVRVKLQDGRDTEYVWIDEFSWTDEQFMGRINGEPRRVKHVKPGQMHRFNRSDIVDWTYVDETGRTFGNFTGCAPSHQAAAAQADAAQRRQDLDCF